MKNVLCRQLAWVIVFLFTAIAAPDVAGGAEGSSPLLALLRKNYDPARSIVADYSLVIYWSVREKKEMRSGSIRLDSGDCFFITTGDERFVSNGTTYWHYNAKSRQVVIKNLANVDMSMLPSQLFARFIVSCPFKQRGREKGIVELAWTNDSAGAPYRTIHVWAREKDGLIAKCLMTDRNGNTFTYTFTGMTTGAKKNRRVFEFAIPKNAAVVDLRE
ncbi:MAG: outer membrane lipoprotein carrier protein LolA [Chitinispirillaceae bacterium]|nr:outer membrane lipoprotein carrier protein LolA [Chitinispirillaceae bacterium]